MRGIAAMLVLCCLVGPTLAEDEPAPPMTPPDMPTELVVEEPGPTRLEFRAEYLYWYLQELRTPPLLTAGPVGSTATIGEPGTVILRGGERIQSRHDRYIGVRTRMDWWFGVDRDVALEADVFFLERDSSHYTVRPNNANVPVLAVPFIDAGTGLASSYVVSGVNATNGPVSGGSRVYSRMELFGQEGNVLFNLRRAPDRELNLIVGTRFLQLRERLDLDNASASLPDGATIFGLEDHFQTFNKFFGAQTGLVGRRQFGRFMIEGKGALALGGNEQLIRNKGVRILHTPLQRIEQPYGLFILPSNRGVHQRWSFDTVTDFRLNIGYELRPWATFLVGYSLMTWNGPVRPGDQVLPVNLSQVTGQGPATPVAPQPNFTEDFFFAHGASVGLTFRW